jgi:uncharacterized membrane protein YphA (DoxX/SURF4 family)
MTLIRAAARTMLASYFVASGVKALRDPAPLVPAAEPVADKIVPLVKQYAPEQVSSFIPTDTATLVRVDGALQIVGGLALATGKGRRVGSWLLATSLIPNTIAKHPFWSRTDPDEKAADRSAFLKNISLLGGVLIATGDTEGKPSLAWRAQKGGHQIAKKTSKASSELARKAEHLTGGGSSFADEALAGGAALLTTVVASSRKARKEATKQFHRAQKVAAEQTKEAQKRAALAAKQAKKDAPKQLRAARKLATERAKEARELAAVRAKEARVRAAEQLKEAQKLEAERAKQAKKEQKTRKNIQRGEN